MKRTKRFAIAIIIIALLVLGVYKVAEAYTFYVDRAYNDDDGINLKLELNGNNQIWINYSLMQTRYNNLYCLDYHQSLSGAKYYTWSRKLRIDGNVVTFSDGTKVTNEANNILAAILTPDDLGRGKAYPRLFCK